MYREDPREAFFEDAISEEEAMGASERFVVQRYGNGFAFRLFDDPNAVGVNLVSMDHLLDFVAEQMEMGAEIRLGD